jgi:glycosyltransferase involved in cell wall biosynthesis
MAEMFDNEVNLSIVIPAYNEEQRLPGTIEKLAKYIASHRSNGIDVLVVDDGSSDGTAKLVSEAMRQYSWLKLVSYRPNKGKGGAVRTGMLQAKGKWRLLTDADLSAPIEEADKLLGIARELHFEVVIGSRGLNRELIERHQSPLREYAGRTFNLCVRMLTGLRLMDTQCGFKLFSARVAQRVFSLQRLDGFGFDVEVLFLAQRLGFNIKEVATRWSHVDGTKVSMIQDSLRMFTDLLRIRSNWVRGVYRTSIQASDNAERVLQ